MSTFFSFDCGIETISNALCIQFIKDFKADHLQKVYVVLDANVLGKYFLLTPYLSRASHLFKRVGSAVRKYHHEV